MGDPESLSLVERLDRMSVRAAVVTGVAFAAVVAATLLLIAADDYQWEALAWAATALGFAGAAFAIWGVVLCGLTATALHHLPRLSDRLLLGLALAVMVVSDLVCIAAPLLLSM